MRGLRKYLTPFAPDQSGAVSVLFELGGIVVICDAGGCTGNVCGFDEPRWFEQKSAIFSAGLRDMDAILGRDDRLVAKLADVVQKIDATFVAVIGTPVPAVIATDYLALKRMSEKKIKLPILTVDTDGMELYDKGEEKAFLELFKIFAIEKYQAEEDRIGILGMTPQDVSDLDAADKIRDLYQQKYGKQAVCYCMGDGLEEIREASSVSRNIVVPLVDELIPDVDYTGKEVLIVHQQVIANSIRKELLKKGAKRVQIASWFMMKKELLADGDVLLRDEDAYIELVQNGDFDIIFADGCMERMIPEFKGIFVDTRHFAVSGKLIGK